MGGCKTVYNLLKSGVMLEANGKLVKIGTAAELLGVSVQTLRNWDDTGELPPAHRSAGGTRYYARSDLAAMVEGAGAWAVGGRCPYCGAEAAGAELAGKSRE